MDSTERVEATTARGTLRLPGGGVCAGTIEAVGARAVVFTSDEIVRENWPEDQEGELLVGDDPDAGFRAAVALNGMAGSGLDLTLTGELDEQQLATLAMPRQAPYEDGAARALFARLLDLGGEWLDEIIAAFLVELGDRLFERATAPRQGTAERQQYFDALNALKRGSGELRTTFRKGVAARLLNPEKVATTTGRTSADGSRLELVGFAEMEENLALERMIHEALDRYRLDLEALTLRTGDLLGLGGARVKTPFHPHALCTVFDESLKSLGVTESVLLDSLACFHRDVVRRLARFYLHLNARFAEHGLRPGLEEALNRGGSILHRSSEHTPYLTEPRVPARTQSGRERSIASGPRRPPDPAPAAESLMPPLPMDTIQAALEHALAHGARGAAQAPADTAAAAPPEQIAALLAELQSADRIPEGELGELVAEGGVRADQRSSGQLALVDRVFLRLTGGGEVSDELRGSLARLRLPLGQLAVTEPELFSDASHPAHRVLDKLTRLAAEGNFPNPVLARKLDSLTTRIAREYDGDPALLATADQELEQLRAQQADVVERNVGRVISGLKGQEQLRSAQQSVEQLLADTLAGDRVPKALLDLLDTGLRDLLIQTAVRDGTDSPSWTKLGAQLEALRSALGAADDGTCGPEQARAIRPDARQLRDAISAAQPGNVAHEAALRELLDSVAGERPLETCPLPARSAAEAGRIPDQRLEELPRLRRWLNRVDSLRPGTFMSYRGPDGERRRMRLVWISPDGERYAFVNDQGKKVAELSRLQLARKLSHGMQPPTPVEHMSPLHQGVFDALSEAQENLGREKASDTMTPLANNHHLYRQLVRTVNHAQRQGAVHAFLCVEIDAFHLVNELYDSIDGDLVLAEFGQRLLQRDERRALTGRLGDDQFGILLAYRDSGEALALAEAIRSDLAAEPLAIAGEAVTFTVSVGVAVINDSTDSPEAVLARSRAALAEAKADGGNRCRLAAAPEQTGDNAGGRDQRRLIVETAIAEGQLALRAQPIVQRSFTANEEASHHYEVLLAVRGEDGSLEPPGDFIAEAERAGAMVQVDRWVVREVCVWISSLMDRQRQVPQVAINLSGQSLRDDAFTEYVLEQLSDFGVGTSKLCFEFTETGATENLVKSADFVRTLRNIGCKFSLDDFGGGPGSHGYLRQLPVDYVKIDGEIIRGVLDSENDRAMIRSINDLAHFLGQETIAECVETPAVVEPLEQLGVDFLQGWGIGMPRDLDTVGRELRPLET